MNKFFVINKALMTTFAGVMCVDAESFEDCLKQVMPLHWIYKGYTEVPSYFDRISDIKVKDLNTGEMKYYCLEDY